MLKYQPTPENLVHLTPFFSFMLLNTREKIRTPLAGQVHSALPLSVFYLNLGDDPILVVDKSLEQTKVNRSQIDINGSSLYKILKTMYIGY